MLGVSEGDKSWIFLEDEKVWESLHCDASSSVELL